MEATINLEETDTTYALTTYMGGHKVTLFLVDKSLITKDKFIFAAFTDGRKEADNG